MVERVAAAPRPAELVLVTDFGANNKGTISAEGLQGEARKAFILDTTRPEYAQTPGDAIGCVDTRLPEDVEMSESGYNDQQISGGPAVNETVVDMMVTPSQTQPVSVLVARNTRTFVDAGYRVKMHGDSHAGKAGCGANSKKRETLLSNAQNIDIILPTVWKLAVALKLDTRGMTVADARQLISNGEANAKNGALWDATPEQTVDIAVANGATYDELQKLHTEGVTVADVAVRTFDKVQFMKDHPRADGGHNGLFVETLGAYCETVFDVVRQNGGTDYDAAERMLATIIFNVGLPKELIAEETGKGEALPVVVLG